MKKVLLILITSALSLSADCSNGFNEDNCEISPIMPPPKNCTEYEEQSIGMSMMGWGLALIAAIAIVAGTVDQSTGN